MSREAKIVHMKNKYPGKSVIASDGSISVHCPKSGELLAQAVKTCHGDFECNKDKSGARDAFCMEPIAKEARVHKLYAGNKIGHSEEHEERKVYSDLTAEKYGKIPSMKEMEKIAKQEKEEKAQEEKAKLAMQ